MIVTMMMSDLMSDLQLPTRSVFLLSAVTDLLINRQSTFSIP